MENELEEILIREEHLQILITRIEHCLSKPKFHADRNSLPSSNSFPLPLNESVKVKLPKLENSKFNGDVINWQGFWDQFCSAIHENNPISDIDKFSYLKTFLCDSAIATISGLSLSAVNYVPAIELLKGRYGNSQVLVSAYMKKFVLLPKIKNDDDIKGLGNLYNQIESIVRNLQTLKVDTNSYGSLLMSLINEKLATDIRVIIARKFKSEVWDLNEIIEVLKLEIEVKELSVSVSKSFVDKQENEFSSALYSNHKSFVKSSQTN